MLRVTTVCLLYNVARETGNGDLIKTIILISNSERSIYYNAISGSHHSQLVILYDRYENIS
jgi:hypothetical protein